MSKQEATAKDPSDKTPKEAPCPEFNKMLKKPNLSKCSKCGEARYVTEPGMPGTKHCPDCGHWEGLETWTKKHEAAN